MGTCRLGSGGSWVDSRAFVGEKVGDQAARSANAAEASAATATQAFHVGERAYVSITPVLLKPFAVNEKSMIRVVVENGGRTPALDVTVHTCLLSSNTPETIEQAHGRFLSNRSGATAQPPPIPPAKHFEQTLEAPNPLTEEEPAALSKGTQTAYLLLHRHPPRHLRRAPPGRHLQQIGH